MGLMSGYNGGRKFDIDTQGFEFYKLKELADEFGIDAEYDVKGLVIFSTKYGDSPTIILGDRFVNLPKRLSDKVYDMLNNDAVVDAIKNDKVSFKVRTFEDTKFNRGTCYDVTWIDKK